MKLLVIDIGNSHIKLGLFEKDRLTSHWRVPIPDQDPVAAAMAVTDSLPAEALQARHFTACSVVPRVEQAVFHAIEKKLPLEQPPLIVHPSVTKLPITIKSYSAEQLGADRLVNLCAAAERLPDKDVLVMGFGTATTLDVLTRHREFIGGIIIPGVEIFANSLSRNTARLPKVTPAYAPHALGNSTVDCIQIGICNGYLGMLKEIETKIREEYDLKDLMRLATGGSAETINEMNNGASWFHHHAPTLTLEGLKILHRLNREEGPREGTGGNHQPLAT